VKFIRHFPCIDHFSGIKRDDTKCQEPDKLLTNL